MIFFLKAVSNKNWQIRITSLPLFSLSNFSLTEKVVSKILNNNHPSLRIAFREAVLKRKQIITSDLLKWFKSQNPWVRITTAQILASLAIKSFHKEKEIINVLFKALKKEKEKLVIASLCFEIGKLIKKNNFYQNAINYLKTLLDKEKNEMIRWAIIEGLDLGESYDNSNLNISYLFRKEFEDAVNKFNQLLMRKNLGKIKKILFEDSSYSKKPPIFCRGSDLDMFRIIYEGEISASFREVFRNDILSLGVYLKPDEPEWWKENKEEKMFKTAVDVLVYSYPKSCFNRPIINDFIDKKSEIRMKLFDSIKNNLLTKSEIQLIKKTQRLFTLQRLFAISPVIKLKTKEMLLAFKSIVEKGYLSPCLYNDQLYKVNWMTFSGQYIKFVH